VASVKSALPPPKVPMTDPKTGLVTPAWYRYFQTDHERVGGGVEDKVEVAAQSGEVAQVAADTANTAAATAQAAATAANTAASTAQGAADSANTVAAIIGGYPSGLTLTASADGATAKIVVSSHTMIYPDKTVSVTGDTLSGLAYGTSYDIYYDDPARAGGAVTFNAVTDGTAFPSPTNPSRIYIGSAMTPATSGDPDVTGVNRAPYGKNTSA